VLNCGLNCDRCSIDATNSERLMRYVNDAASKDFACNCRVKLIKVGDSCHILLFATRDLPINTELRYDYGTDAPWRKV